MVFIAAFDSLFYYGIGMSDSVRLLNYRQYLNSHNRMVYGDFMRYVLGFPFYWL